MNDEASAHRVYVFAEFTLDTRRARLLRGGAQVPLRPKAFDALVYLVEHRGRLVTKDELIGALWPKVVVTDDSLVKCIQEVRGTLGADLRAAIKTVPRRGYIFDAPVVVAPGDGAPQGGVAQPADIDKAPAAATAAEVGTAERGEPDAHVRGQSDMGLRRVLSHPRALLYVGAVAVLAAVAVGVGVRFAVIGDPSPAAARSATMSSVAVLPFVSISSEPDQDYFSDGISEELLNVLSNIPGLHVPSRTSSFAFKGTSSDLKSIAAALNVGHVLEGSVRKDGDHVRITAQLVDVGSDSLVWSATYDRELTNIFAVQDEIAWSVAAALEVELLAEDLPENVDARTPSTDAHDAYLLGLHYLRTLRSEDLLRARESFLRAIQLDAGYAAAHAGLVIATLSAQGYGHIDRESAQAEADRAAARALELAPSSAAVRSASGTALAAKGDWAASDAAYRRAIALNAGFAPAHFGRFLVLGRSGRMQESRESLARALELDPLNAQYNWWMGNAILQLGDTTQAAAYYRRGIEFEPTQPNNYSGLGDVAIVTGRLDEGLQWFLTGLEQDPGQPHMSSIVGLMYLSLGDADRAAEWFEHVAGLYGDEAIARLFRNFMPLVERNENGRELLDLLGELPPAAMSALGTRLFRKAALRTGDVGAIGAFYRRRWPALFAPEPRVDATNFGIATDVAWLARMQGERDRAARLLERVLEVAGDPAERSIEPIDWASVMVETEALALQGRRDEALAAFRRAADTGWRFDWWQVQHDPIFESLRSEREFDAIITEVKADLAAQLERVRGLERAGRLRGAPR